MMVLLNIELSELNNNVTKMHNILTILDNTGAAILGFDMFTQDMSGVIDFESGEGVILGARIGYR